jgi:hypothetical protein
MALASEEEKVLNMDIGYMLFKVFFATMDIHLMFDNLGLICTLNGFFCVQCVFDELE